MPPPASLPPTEAAAPESTDLQSNVTLALRAARGTAQTSPTLFRLLSTILTSLHVCETKLHAFILVDVLHQLGVPKTCSSLALYALAVRHIRRVYLAYPKTLLTALPLLNPISQSIAVILDGPPQSQQHWLAFWSTFASLHIIETLRVAPLKVDLTTHTVSSGGLRQATSRLLHTLARSKIAQYLPTITPITPPKPISNKPTVSLLKRTFGPRWPLIKLALLLILQSSRAQPAYILIKWLIQPLRTLLRLCFPSHSPQRGLKIIYAEEEEHQLTPPPPPPPPEGDQTPKRHRCINSATEKDWSHASQMLDSSILTADVWNTGSPKPARTRRHQTVA